MSLLLFTDGYSKRDILYEWSGAGVGLEPGVELSQYNLVNISTKNKQIVIRENGKYCVFSTRMYLKHQTVIFISYVLFELRILAIGNY